MKKLLALSLVSTVFILGSPRLFAEETATTVPPAAGQMAAKGMHHRQHEHHPKIHAALRKLRHAKEDLEQAANDFGGHKAKAIQAIDQAVAELREALKADKK